MSLYVFSKAHEVALVLGEHIDLCVYISSRALLTRCLWPAALPGDVAPLIAVNGDSMCRHHFLHHAFLAVIII